MAFFGTIISDARKKAGLSQKDLASRIKKNDGDAISPQYLNDIEHDRRNPPSEPLIEQFAKTLNLPKDALMAAAGILSEDLRRLAAEKIAADKPGRVTEAIKAFRKRMEQT
jgi:transcriptional regulator with XRE-family HTH domain